MEAAMLNLGSLTRVRVSTGGLFENAHLWDDCNTAMQSTKQLARELGILRRKKLATGLSGTSRRRHAHNQIFSFVVVLDFESTCWDNGQHRTNEIIEFPAVLLNTSTGEIESEFHYYVLPQENPVLSDFCKQLTGITQEQVEEGIPLQLCVQKFHRWLTRLSREKGICFSPSPGSEASSATFVTWSDWDLGVCLLYECRRKQITRPPALNCWIDLRLTYRKFYERKPKGLNGALQDVGISFEGREHSGLHDARNTARLAWRMIQDGCVLRITKTLPASGGPRRTAPFLVAPTGNSGLKARDPARQSLQRSSSVAPGHREENSTAMQISSSTPRHREENSTATKTSSSTPGHREENSTAMQISSSTPRHREENSTATQTSSSTPRHREENSTAMQTSSRTPRHREENSTSTKTSSSTPGHREENSTAMQIGSSTPRHREENSTSTKTSSSTPGHREENSTSTQTSSSTPGHKENCATVLNASSPSGHRKENTTNAQANSRSPGWEMENSTNALTSFRAVAHGKKNTTVQTPESRTFHANTEALCPHSAGRATSDWEMKQQGKQHSGLQLLSVSGKWDQQKSFGSTTVAATSKGEFSSAASCGVSSADKSNSRTRSKQTKNDDGLLSASKPYQAPASSEGKTLDLQTSVLVSSFVEDCEDIATDALQEQDSGCSEEVAGVDLSLLHDSNDSEGSTSTSQVLISSFVEGEWDSGFETSVESSRQTCPESPAVQEIIGTVQAATGFNQGSSKLGTVPKRTFAWSSPSQDTSKVRKIQPHSPSAPAQMGLQMRDMNKNLAFSASSKGIRQQSMIPTSSSAIAHAYSQRQNCFKTPSPVADNLGKLKSNQGPCTSTPKLSGIDRMPLTSAVHWKSNTHSPGPLPKASFSSARLTQRCPTSAPFLNKTKHRQTKDQNGEDVTPMQATTKIELSAHVTSTSPSPGAYRTSGVPTKSALSHLPLWASRSISSGSASVCRGSSSMKRTPPLCQCGRRARRRMVQTPGPNQSRLFFSCSLGRAPCMGGNSKTGCGFFQWEGPETPVRGLRN